jgi:hypothetical protein
MARKTLSIGITINLENYENLRLDVEGEVGDDGDAEELISFLDGMLARLGHGDQVTAERVEAYRRRVLAYPKAVIAAVPGPARKEGEVPPAAIRPAPAGVPREASPPVPDPVRAEARKEVPSAPAREEQPVTVRVSTEAKAVKPAPRTPVRAEEAGAPPGAVRVPEPRKPTVAQPPKEGAKEEAKPEKPHINEGEVACEGCGLSITKNQEKLSRLLTGKSLCKRCMNP